MSAKRKIELFSAGCGLCDEAVQLVKDMACPGCDIEILDMSQARVVERAKALGVARVPAVAIDGQIVSCCAGSGPNRDELAQAGLGQA